MKCPKCGSPKAKKEDDWVYRCLKCGHTWAP